MTNTTGNTNTVTTTNNVQEDNAMTHIISPIYAPHAHQHPRRGQGRMAAQTRRVDDPHDAAAGSEGLEGQRR